MFTNFKVHDVVDSYIYTCTRYLFKTLNRIVIPSTQSGLPRLARMFLVMSSDTDT